MVHFIKFKPTELYQDNGIGRIGVLAKLKMELVIKKHLINFLRLAI